MIDVTKLTDIQMGSVDTQDYPDLTDAFVESACYENGVELTEKELDEVNEDSDFVHTQALEWLQ